MKKINAKLVVNKRTCWKEYQTYPSIYSHSVENQIGKIINNPCMRMMSS